VQVLLQVRSETPWGNVRYRPILGLAELGFAWLPSLLWRFD
jgi:hypothetical protein